MTNKQQAIKALNRVDQIASAYLPEDWDLKDEMSAEYDKVFVYLARDKQRLEVNLSEEDCRDLIKGKDFNWTFPDQHGEDVDINLFHEV